MATISARPVVLLGETRSSGFVERMRALGWGRMWTTKVPTRYDDSEPWGFDNGAFAAWRQNESFPHGTFMSRLALAKKVGIPLLAVTPDIVGGGERSLEFSLDWRTRLPDEWPWYLAVQDGMAVKDVADVLPSFAGLFLGGTTRFKATAAVWANLAHGQGKPFHYGRASLPRRVDHALRVGADSLDSAFPLWTVARFNGFVAHWVQHGSQQLDFGHGSGPSSEWF